MNNKPPDKISIPIDKEWILQQVREEDIISKFLPCSLDEINGCVNHNKLICSPLRSNDTSPSMGMRKYPNGKVWVKDFNGTFEGDCFDIVERRLTMAFNDTPKFIQILEAVLVAFNLSSFKLTYDVNTVIKIKETTDFLVSYRDYSYKDESYWKKYYIDIDRLFKFDVYFIARIVMYNRTIYTYSAYDPCYGYFGGYNNDGIAIWKFYFPLRRNTSLPRFLCNIPRIEGGKFIKEAKFGIIIKSYKDVIACDVLELDAIAPPAESVLFTVEQMVYVKKHWKIVYTLSDFDRAGILFGLRMQRLHGTIPLFFTNGNYGTIDFGAKDLTDYMEKYGLAQTIELRDYIITNGIEQTNDWFDFIHNYLHHK